jgi:hypothetical protein
MALPPCRRYRRVPRRRLAQAAGFLSVEVEWISVSGESAWSRFCTYPARTISLLRLTVRYPIHEILFETVQALLDIL